MISTKTGPRRVTNRPVWPTRGIRPSSRKAQRKATATSNPELKSQRYGLDDVLSFVMLGGLACVMLFVTFGMARGMLSHVTQYQSFDLVRMLSGL